MTRPDDHSRNDDDAVQRDSDRVTQCHHLLRLVDAIPSTVHWHVTHLAERGLLFIADSREESTLMELAAIAGQFGSAVAEASIQSCRTTGHTIAGLIVQRSTGGSAPYADEDDEQVAGRLRAAIHLATTKGEGPESFDDDGGPF